MGFDFLRSSNTHFQYITIFRPHTIAMSEIKEIIKALVDFRDERDWKQFHDSKNLATALSIEVAELNELFLWKDVAASEEVDKEKIREELADVFAYAFLMAERHGLDVKEIVLEKIARNGEKYPVDKAKGNAKKYTDL
jgi:NTP pyrophosphatase (non-canonical NTP hydrolase)